ncbi:MAG: redox-sensing transcriptional repressor Rex [bacterium]
MRRGTPQRTIERIGQYRRLLYDVKKDGRARVYSHDLADRIGGTAAQIRRDLMLLGCSCGSKTGYPVDQLLSKIAEFLDNPEGENVALIGIGNVGRALLSFFSTPGPSLKVTAAFDRDQSKVGRVLHGCRCYVMEDMERVLAEQCIKTAIMAVPAGDAQGVAEKLAACGVRGILNFAPVPLRVPPGVFVERIDMTVALEKVAFFSRQASGEEQDKV